MWKLDTGERIAHWREFRRSLDSLTFNQAIDSVAKFWQRCPFTPYYLDPTDAENWPDPWTLIYENHYCDIAKCLGIMYTILLTKHRINLDIEMRVYEDPETKYVYNLCWINQGKYIINLIDGETVNKEQFQKILVLKRRYTAEELQLDNY